MSEQNHKVTIPGYQIIRKIGEGGMSVVYLAYQESLKREVALKVMRPIITDGSDVVRRFEQEAEIIAKLYHPNIVSIYEVGHNEDNLLFYSMPYLQHGDLTTFTYHDDKQLKEVMAAICEGLSFAHAQGVVHRDIKPENILFDQFGQVLLADFGIALSTGRRRLTKDSRIIGSVYYMSPEQAQAKHVDARSDIYALGAILYEILTGEPVFDRDNDFTMMLAHVNDPVPRLPDELAHWQGVIDKCLAKSPNHRYQNVNTLKEAILAINPLKQPPKKSWKKSVAVVSSLFFVMLLTYFIWISLSKEKPSPKQAIPSQQIKMDSNKSQLPVVPTVEFEEVQEPVLNTLSEQQVRVLLSQAQSNIDKKQLTTPEDDNALDQLLLVLKNIPNHPQAISLLSDVMAGYYELVYQAVQKNNHQQALGFAGSVAEVRHRTILTHEQLYAALEQNTELERSLLLGAIAEKVTQAKQSKNREQAERLIALVDAVIPGHEIIDELNELIASIPTPGNTIRDNQGLTSIIIAPEMNGIKGLVNYALAVSETEVSFSLFDRFVAATGHELSRCKSLTGNNVIFSQRHYAKPGFPTQKNDPVVCVSWQDANLFIHWYNQISGENYRMPSVREWGHLIKLSQVKVPACGTENLAGTEFPKNEAEFNGFSCNDHFPYVAPLTAFKPNVLGLYGLHGNVSEWLSGCQELGKFKAIFNPDDQCESNPVAGLSWASGPADVGDVKQIKFNQAWSHIGFRLVKKL
ncbi:MAG: bifunctional serine/threonine-protein kinase/formylglycine-generating enzyme family protein [Marinicella sp.]